MTNLKVMVVLGVGGCYGTPGITNYNSPGNLNWKDKFHKAHTTYFIAIQNVL